MIAYTDSGVINPAFHDEQTSIPGILVSFQCRKVMHAGGRGLEAIHSGDILIEISRPKSRLKKVLFISPL